MPTRITKIFPWQKWSQKLRKHVAAVYAFARTADDIADEQHETLAADDQSE
ncbi:MAG: squalene/phytoene synthase family protein [Bacilli bacterium]